MKQKLTPQRQEEILYSLNHIYISIFSAETEHMVYLHDTKFKDPIMNNFSKRIKSDILEMKKRLGVTVPDEDFAEERMLEIHRLLKFFSDKNTEELKMMNDRIEEETLALQI